MDVAKIELAAKRAMVKRRKVTGVRNLDADIAKAVAAAIVEYDKQKSQDL